MAGFGAPAARYRVLAPDLLGYGDTCMARHRRWPDPSGGRSRARSLRISTAITYSAIRMAVPVPRLALEEPHRLKSLTLIEPIAIFLLDPVRDAGPYGLLREIAEVYRNKVAHGNPDVGITRYFDYWNGGEPLRRHIRARVNMPGIQH